MSPLTCSVFILAFWIDYSYNNCFNVFVYSSLIFALFGFVWLFSQLWVVFLCLGVLGSFSLNVRQCGFYLVRYWVFCKHRSILELYSRAGLSYGNSLIPLACIYKLFWGGCRINVEFSWGLVFLSTRAKPFLVFHLMTYRLGDFLFCLVGTSTIPCPM